MRGVHTTLNVIWDWEAPAGGGDTHFAVYRGTKARVEVRQTKADRYQPEVYVDPESGGAMPPAILAASRRRVAALQADVSRRREPRRRGAEIHVVIPDRCASATRRTSPR